MPSPPPHIPTSSILVNVSDAISAARCAPRTFAQPNLLRALRSLRRHLRPLLHLAENAPRRHRQEERQRIAGQSGSRRDGGGNDLPDAAAGPRHVAEQARGERADDADRRLLAVEQIAIVCPSAPFTWPSGGRPSLPS